MKVAFARAGFLAALEQVAKVAPTSKTIPILNHFRLDAEESLRLTATDLVSTIVVTAPGGVKEPGSALIHAQDFLAYLREQDEHTLVSLVTVEAGMQSKIGPDAWLWKAPPVDQFPHTATLEAQHTHTLPRDALVRSLRAVKTAAAGASFNPKLEQVGIRRGKVQAADGISCHEVTLADSAQMDIALPLPFLDDVVALLGPSVEPTIDIGVPEDGQSLVLRHGDVTLMTACKKETFPDVSHAFLIPVMANPFTLSVAREVLVRAVRRVRIMSEATTKAVKITLSGFSTAEVSAQRQSGAWAKETVAVEWAGGDRVLVFNHEYLLHLLALFSEDVIVLRLGEDAKHKPSPVYITEGGRSGVLMQLRLDWS